MPAYRLEIASRGQAGCNGELSTSWTDRDADQACVWPRSFLGDEVQDQLQALSTSLELGSEISSSEESSRSLLIVSLNSGQKPCKGTKIAKGELRLGTWVTILEHGSLRWRHWGCK